MSDPEAIGDAIPGGVLGRAVEPGAGEVGADGHTRESACLNCGTRLEGDFCLACGQRAHVHRTLGAFFHDLLHGVLHFEGKTWRTVPMLAWKPGELTHRYVEGQRARFVSPIAIFLFSVFLMFAAVSVFGGPLLADDPASQAQVDAELAKVRDDASSEIAELQRRRDQLRESGRPTAEVDRQIAEVRQGLATQEALLGGLLGGRAPAEGPTAQSSVRVTSDQLPFDSGWLDSAYRKAKQNPSLLLYKLQANAYKFSWALIPISLPLVWLMFLHRRRYRAFGAYDHTVFVTYSLAFMSLLTIAAMIAANVGLGWLLLPLAAYVPVHMYRHLKGAYLLSAPSALWRTAVLMVFSWIALGLFGMAILAMGISA